MRTIRYLIYYYSPLHLILYLYYFYYNDLHVLKLLKNVQSEPKLNSSLKFKNFYLFMLCYVLFCYILLLVKKFLYCICFLQFLYIFFYCIFFLFF